MKKRSDKEKDLEILKTDLANVSTIILTTFQGTTVEEDTKLRRSIQAAGGHYRVRIDGAWIDVPDEAVITEPNRIGRTMVWPIRGYLGISVRCFMPGSMT